MQVVQYSGEHNWNFIGKFFGINPRVLAAFNGDDDILEPPAKTIRIPNAEELTAYYPEFIAKYSAAHPDLDLPAPTLLNPISGSSFAKYGLVSKGNMVIVNAARMRRSGHTGDNYEKGQPLRTLNMEHRGARVGPDQHLLSESTGWWKCNVFVGDVMYASGYDWPMSEFQRYFQPNGIVRRMVRPDNGYADVVWVAPRFAGGNDPDPKIPYVNPTAADLRGVMPGDVVLLHGSGEAEASHAAIATSPIRTDKEGRPVIRLIDVYGEHWHVLDEEGLKIKAVVRPKKKKAKSPAATVGGDINHPLKVLDSRNWTISDVSLRDKDAWYPTLEP